MKTNSRIIKYLGLLSLLLLHGPALGTPIDVSHSETHIRGRVVRVTNDAGAVGVLHTRVDLYKAGNLVKTTYTDAEGYYYVWKLAKGPYKIQVNQKVYDITVKPKASGKQFQDIPPIRFG